MRIAGRNAAAKAEECVPITGRSRPFIVRATARSSAAAESKLAIERDAFTRPLLGLVSYQKGQNGRCQLVRIAVVERMSAVLHQRQACMRKEARPLFDPLLRGD